ncbi:DUF948 domain-containing protein [Paenibacillus senegalensis]|uniref:DUF948 domain-containing protein n=1 Tax=Paenibacillus senegalensis TaxID=1465766 RepID=UPI000287D5CD|nr:DUF948 domain-containing protein [Paenibacillus senegalensis]
MWEIAVLIIALAFAVLTVFVIQTLRTVQDTLKETNRTVKELKEDINEITIEVKGLIRTTNQITMDVRSKMRTLDPLFGSVENMGGALEGVTASIRQASATLRDNFKRSSAAVNQGQVEVPASVKQVQQESKLHTALHLLNSAYELWQRYKMSRMSKAR